MRSEGSLSQLPLPLKLGILAAGCAAAAYFSRQRRCMEFHGKSVVITGGSRGLGLELARGFAAEGANIVLLARDKQQLAEAERELQRFGVRVAAFSCDVTNHDQVLKTVAEVAPILASMC